MYESLKSPLAKSSGPPSRSGTVFASRRRDCVNGGVLAGLYGALIEIYQFLQILTVCSRVSTRMRRFGV